MKVGNYKSNLLEMFNEKLNLDDSNASSNIPTAMFTNNSEMESTKLAFEEFLKQKKEIAMKAEKTHKDRSFIKINNPKSDNSQANRPVLNGLTPNIPIKLDKANDVESRLRKNMHKPYSSKHKCSEEPSHGICSDHIGDACDHVEAKKCDCTYCAVFGTAPKNTELRDRLRVRLHQRREKRSKDMNKPAPQSSNIKTKNTAANRVETRVPLPSSPTNIPSAPSVSSTDSLNAGIEIPTNDIHGILNYIEGNTGLNKQELAEKKAAKKARQRQKKEDERIQAEEEAKRKAEEIKRKEEERKRELERQLEEKRLSEVAQKKKDKKRRQAIKKQGGVEVIEETVPAVITIKRVADENAKPKVVITLKGCTPDQASLLYSLVDDSEKNKPQRNAMEPTSKKNKKRTKDQTKEPDAPVIVSKNIDLTVAVDKNSSNKPQQVVNANFKKKDNVKKSAISINHIDEALGNLRLPPGITITKVDAPVNDRSYVSNDPPKGTTIVGKSGVIVVDTEQLGCPPVNGKPQPPLDQSKSKKKKSKKNKKTSEYLASTNIINTKQIKISSKKDRMVTLKNPFFSPYQNPNINPSPKSVETSDHCAPAAIFTSGNGMVTIRSSRLQQCMDNAPMMPANMLPSWPGNRGYQKDSGDPYVKKCTKPQEVVKSNRENVSLAVDAQEILSGLPGIEITKLDKSGLQSDEKQSILPPVTISNNEIHPKDTKDDWLYDSVFKPRDILEDDMDADELELEAFKRFCSQSVPPKQKEKVAHLNVADIFWKKETDQVK